MRLMVGNDYSRLLKRFVCRVLQLKINVRNDFYEKSKYATQPFVVPKFVLFGFSQECQTYKSHQREVNAAN